MKGTAKKRIVPERLTLGGIFEQEARKLGIRLELEPEWKVAGQITTKSGKRRYFKTMSLDLNTQGAAALASDKDYAAYFLKKMGYPVPMGASFHSDEWRMEIDSSRNWRKASAYAERLGFPVIVKPNSKSQGKGVVLAHGQHELENSLKAIFAYDRIALVQKPIVGKDFRIVVLDGAVISAYQRLPLSVLGDGRSSIKALLVKKQAEFEEGGRDTQIKAGDPRIAAKLRLQGWTLKYVPKAGEHVQLLDNANLSAGGDALDVTKEMHPAWKRLAAQIARDMNLRFTGIDVIVPEGLSVAPKKYWLLEVNDSPGLDNYASIGPAQKKVVKNLYRAVLRALVR